MMYSGGKFRIGKAIAEFVMGEFNGHSSYIEPFVGSAWVLIHIELPVSRMAYDINESLILMWQELQHGWVPPSEIDREAWKVIREMDGDFALKSFVRFGCSYGGNWNGGFAFNSGGSNYAIIARDSLLRKLPFVLDVQFQCRDYCNMDPSGSLIYCDPPYPGASDVYGTGKFDHAEFWEIMRLWSEKNTVIVSSHVAPDDFVCCVEFDMTVSKGCYGRHSAAAGNKRRTEKLFMWIGGL